MTEPARLLALPLSQFLAQVSPTAQLAQFVVVWNGTVYAYAYSDKALARAYWEAQSGFTSWYDIGDNASVANSSASTVGLAAIVAVAMCDDMQVLGFTAAGWAGAPRTLATSGAVVYCRGLKTWFGTNGAQIIKSTDGGVTWSVAFTPATGNAWVCIATDGASHVVASDPVAGRTATTSNGTAWTERANLPATAGGGGTITGGNGIFLAARGPAGLQSELYRSNDFGVTWTHIALDGLYLSQPHCLGFSGGLFCIGSNQFADGNPPNLYRTADCVTFTPAPAQPTVGGVIESLATDGAGNWLVTSNTKDAQFSSDNMATWHAVAQTPARPLQTIFSRSLGWVVVGEGRMLVRSADPVGAGWTVVNQLGGSSDLHAIDAIDTP